MQSNSYLSDCKEKVQICLGEMMKDFGWNGTQDRFSYKMIEALKRRRPLVAPDDYFTRHTEWLEKLMRTCFEISRSNDLGRLSQDGAIEHGQLSNQFMDQGCTRLFMSSVTLTDFVFAAKIDGNRPNGICSFGEMGAIVNLPLNELRLDNQSENFKKWCESCKMYLMRSTADGLKDIKTYQLGALDKLLSNKNGDWLKLKPAVKLKKSKSSSEGQNTDSFTPVAKRREIGGKEYWFLVWNDLRAEFNDKFDEFKKDGRSKRGVSGNSNQETLVAKKYYNLVVTFDLPPQNIHTSRSHDFQNQHRIEKLRNYFVSPELVLEMHTKLDIDPDGFYLWKLTFESLNQPQLIEDVVDQMLMPRYRGVLTNAYEFRRRECPSDQSLDNVCDQTTRVAMILKCFKCLKPQERIASTTQNADREQIRELVSAAKTTMITADQLVSESVPITDSTEKTRVWNWFGSIFNAIDLQRSGRQSTKDSVTKTENFGLMILDGFHFGMMTRENAESVLKGHKAGTFLLRFSNSKSDSCNLVSAIDDMGQYSHGTFAVGQKESVLCRVLNIVEKFNFCVLNKLSMKVFNTSHLAKYCHDRKKKSDYEGVYQDGSQALTQLGIRIKLDRLRIEQANQKQVIPAANNQLNLQVFMGHPDTLFGTSNVARTLHSNGVHAGQPSNQFRGEIEMQVPRAPIFTSELPNLDNEVEELMLGIEGNAPNPMVSSAGNGQPDVAAFFQTSLGTSNFTQEMYPQNEVNNAPREMIRPTPHRPNSEGFENIAVPDSGASLELFGSDDYFEAGADEGQSNPFLRVSEF